MSLAADLKRILPSERVKTRLIDRHSYARDASFYRLIPQAVVKPRNEDDIQALFSYSRKAGIPLVFRSAGTSLSGQAITDGILVETVHDWKDHHISEDAAEIRLQPGIIGAKANQLLAPLSRKIGPDPASINAAMIGGMVANNASGMCCGVKENSYHTMASIRAILPNGHILDTGDPHADERLREDCPDLHTGLLRLRDEVRGNELLTARIRDKYTRKNTLGYSLNAFIDYDEPSQILAHLLVGSEGTLAFISEVRLRTIADDAFKSAALLFFEDIRAATEAVIPLRDAGARALELMDRPALGSVQDEAGMPGELNGLPPEAAALLCEFQAADRIGLDTRVAAGLEKLQEARLLHPPKFTTDQSTRDLYWKIRKGLFPAVGAVRKSGTTVIIEDVCFRLEDLADATLELQGLFKRHGYEDAIIFGHAKDGNLHFVISQAFNDDSGQEQYRRFIDDVVSMTSAKYDGALKAEHGTGRNMAPFVETEWGTEALEIMRELKALLDPELLLNPGVIINDDPQAHLKNIKPTPSIVDVADRCIECGFCETWCPSDTLSMSPRRRIATWREVQTLEGGDHSDREAARQLKRDYAYESVDTCAVDGLCALGCPVKIDTGDLTRHFRQEQHGLLGLKIADWTVNHFAGVVKSVRGGLKISTPTVRLLGSKWISRLSRKIYKLSGRRIPAWHEYMPLSARSLPEENLRGDKEVVYFISCLNRAMGETPGEEWKQSSPEALITILTKAGIRARYPEDLEGLCCGTPYSSKGFDDAYQAMAEKTVSALWTTSQKGRVPILVDTSPCTYKMKNYGDILTGEHLEKWQSLQILDIIEYLHDEVLPELNLRPAAGTVVLHPTCSTQKMGLESKMLSIAQQCSENASYPDELGCCGFAGDRGFLIPELTEAATLEEGKAVQSLDADGGHFSTSRTCEMGMSHATGKSYSALIHLIASAVRD